MVHLKHVATTLALFMISFTAMCQDSLKLESELSIEIRGQHVLKALSPAPTECFNCGTRTVSDNPMHHFAIFSGLNYTGTLHEKHSFEIGLYAEERSFSGGNNTMTNLVFFPKMLISSWDTFTVSGKKMRYNAKAGDFWDEDFYDIIRFYNIDFHGLQAEIGTQKTKLQFSVIGDLSQNIGFALHELYKFAFIHKTAKFKHVSSISVNELFDAPRGNHPDPRDVNIAHYSSMRLKNQSTVKGQIEIRNNSSNSGSLAAAIQYKTERNRLSMTHGIRYFQADFNQGYRSFFPRYRAGNSYVGSQLYPLKNYYRPQNQWALYTNFQNADLLGYEFTLNWDKQLYKKLRFLSEVDFNLIYNLNNDDIRIYPLYNVGFQIDFVKRFSMFLTTTNKHQNLDTFFQTAYASKNPLLSYGFRMNLEEIKLRTVFVR